MSDLLGVTLGLLFVSFMLGTVLFIMFTTIRGSKKSQQAELKKGKEYLAERLMTPDFDAAERHLKCPIPRRVAELYANREILLDSDFYLIDPVEDKTIWPVSSFLPVKPDIINKKWPSVDKAFFIAETNVGQYYFLRVDCDQEGLCPVYAFFPEEKAVVRVCDSLHDFLGWQRVAVRHYHWQQENRTMETTSNGSSLYSLC